MYILIIIFLVCYVYVIYNKLNYNLKEINYKFIKLDEYFKKRIELIPTLINIFKQYNLEKETIDKLTFLINDNYDNKNEIDKLNFNIELNNLINHLWEIVDANLILKQNPVFLNVIKHFNTVESEIINYKNIYNKVVHRYNNLVKYNKLVAIIFKHNIKFEYNIDETKRPIIKTDKEVVVID